MSGGPSGLLEGLQARVAAELADLAEQPFALVDFPDHANVGDSAIWLGTTAFFRRQHAVEPRYVASIAAFSPAALRRAHPEGPILIHGGGNFGDLWPRHQAFRERLLETFPDRLIVQLPQSVHYGDTRLADRTARVIARHGNVRLLVRDQPSLEFAAARFDCAVRLCPDLALCLGPMARPTAPRVDVLCLFRTDRERAAHYTLPRTSLDVEVRDWLGEARLPVRLHELTAVLARLRSGPRPAAALRLARYEPPRPPGWPGVVACCRPGDWWSPTALHAHLLSLLLAIPHAVLDNTYGKLGRFLDTWTGGGGGGAPGVHGRGGPGLGRSREVG
jgi:pyruvyl transferase EpsO